MYKDIWFSDVLEDLSKQDTPVFEDLKGYLNSIGLRAVLIYVNKRKTSSVAAKGKKKNEYKTVPTLTVFADRKSYKEFIGEPERMGLLREDIAKEVVREWEKLCRKYNTPIDEDYDEDMYICLLNYELAILDTVIRKNKPMAENMVYKFSKVMPRDVYASSRPSFEIVFHKEEDYIKASEYFDSIVLHIEEEIMSQAVKYQDSFSEKPFIINFWHPKKQGYNGYGIARED